jgi:hypothetical protein
VAWLAACLVQQIVYSILIGSYDNLPVKMDPSANDGLHKPWCHLANILPPVLFTRSTALLYVIYEKHAVTLKERRRAT